MSLNGEQKLYGTNAAPQKYLQQGLAGVGHAIALSAARGGHDVVDVAGGVGVDVVVVVVEVRQLQALEIRELPQVATGLGACLVLFESVVEG